MHSSADAELRARVLDALSTFFYKVNTPGPSTMAVEQVLECFATGLLKVLPRGFDVFWQDKTGTIATARDGHRPSGPRHTWPPAEAATRPPVAYGDFAFQSLPLDTGGSAVVLSQPSQNAVLGILSEAQTELTGNLFFESVRDGRLLYSALRAVLLAQETIDAGHARAEAERARAELERATSLRGVLRSLTRDQSIGVGDRVSRVLAEVRDRTNLLPVDASRDVAVWLVQELLRSGWQAAELTAGATSDELLADVTKVAGLLRGTLRRSSSHSREPATRIDVAALASALDTLDVLTEAVSEHAPPWSPGSELPAHTPAHDHDATTRATDPRSTDAASVEVSAVPWSAEPGREKDADVEALRKGLLASLPEWTWEQCWYRRLSNEPWRTFAAAPPQADRSEMTPTTRDLLWRYLWRQLARAGFEPPPQSTGARWEGGVSPRALATLWFCLKPLDHLHGSCGREPLDAADPPTTRARLRADLAFVIRECVRFACFGRRADFLLQPAVYSASLATVVRYHAERILGLSPRYEIGELLARLGRAEGLNRGHQPVQHLRHVLDVYVCGSLLLDLRFNGSTAVPAAAGTARTDADAPTVGHSMPACRLADVLATGARGERADSRQGDVLRRAFALAGLFHDIGYLLFPSAVRPTAGLAHGNPVLANAFSALDTKLAGSAAALVKPATSALLNSPYCDARNEEALAKWIEAQRSARHPDHGLLSAYYLHHVCSRVRDDGDVQKQAVRAALLHSTPEVEIDAARDPAASLLVLANELFEWDPERSLAPTPAAVGRSFHLVAADVSHHEPRAWAIGLDVGWQDEGRGWEPVLRQDARGWPLVNMHLQLPQRLEAPVYHLWLLKAQQLGRIVRAPSGWSPRLRLYVPPDTRLPAGLTIHAVLQSVVGSLPAPLRGALDEWLVKLVANGAYHVTDSGHECVTLGRDTAFAADVDLDAMLPALDRAVDGFLLRDWPRVRVREETTTSPAAASDSPHSAPSGVESDT